MNIFVLKNNLIKVYIYHFSINIFIKTRSQSYVLETVSLSKTTFFTSTEGVYINTAVAKQLGCQTIQLSKQGEREREQCFGARTGGHGEQRTASLRSVASVLSAFERSAMPFIFLLVYLSWTCPPQLSGVELHPPTVSSVSIQ
jgi:hypothetical protein